MPSSVPGVVVPERPAQSDDATGGNSRLTAATGLVMVALLAVEAVTLLGVRQMLTVHVVVGALLIGTVVLKSGSTIYRFVRYYTGAAAYRKHGPPAQPLRLIGPLIIVATLGVLGTGVALIIIGPSGSDLLLTAHKASFWVFIGLLAIHLLGHLWQAAVLSWHEVRDSLHGPQARQRSWRYAAILVALVVGVGAATMLVPSTSPWTDRPGHSARGDAQP